MAFDNLSDKLSGVFKRLRSKGKLSEADVKTAMREVRLALLEADVNYKVAKDFTNAVTEKCIGENVMESLTAPQTVVKIVKEELTTLMGSEQARLKISNKIAPPPTKGSQYFSIFEGYFSLISSSNWLFPPTHLINGFANIMYRLYPILAIFTILI